MAKRKGIHNETILILEGKTSTHVLTLPGEDNCLQRSLRNASLVPRIHLIGRGVVSP